MQKIALKYATPRTIADSEQKFTYPQILDNAPSYSYHVAFATCSDEEKQLRTSSYIENQLSGHSSGSRTSFGEGD